jgi:hypothetical protein
MSSATRCNGHTCNEHGLQQARKQGIVEAACCVTNCQHWELVLCRVAHYLRLPS